MGSQERETPCPLNFTAAMAKPFLLWPATQKMAPVTIRAMASDGKACGLSCTITSLASNEPQARNTNWQITGDLTLNVLADRLSTSYGRIYTATVQCMDNAGNSNKTQTAPIAVPAPHVPGN